MSPSASESTGPLVSVITNSYNAHRFLRANIDSVRKQDYAHWEHIVIDCGSTDGSVELVRSLAHPRLRLIQVPFCGVSMGRRHGIAESRGELVAILDADDTSVPDRISSQVKLLAADPDVVGCGGGIIEVTEQTARSRRYVYPREHSAIVRLLRVVINACPHSTLTFRRAAYEKVGGYSDVFEKSEDFDFLLSLAHVGRLASLGRPVTRYTVHRDSHTEMHRPMGRDAAYYAMLAAILHALDDRADAPRPAVSTITSFLDRVGPGGISAMRARWTVPALMASSFEGDLASMRYLASALAHGVMAVARHRGDAWWSDAKTLDHLATTLLVPSDRS